MNYNKLVIFDLDGVLVESKDWHYTALNDALLKIGNEYVISIDEHLSKYDGLTTTKKLELLSINKGLEKKYFDQIWNDKQYATFDILKQIQPSSKLISIFSWLKTKDIKIAVATNSIRESVKLCLLKLGILEYVDYYVSNEDVTKPKPFPEMYWKCMTALNAIPKSTLIVEDSHIGRKGALDSGANLLAVENTNDLSLAKIEMKINEINSVTKENTIPWIDAKLNVLIPMAGLGSRFSQQGYTFPKPLIDVNGKPMIQVVVDNLNIDANYIFVVQQEHLEKYNIKHLLNLIKPNCKIVVIDGLTEGAACTTLLAKEFIDNDNPLLIANSDQYIEWNSNETMYSFSNNDIDGGMLVFNAVHPKWSFAKLGLDGFVEQVAEKDPISNIASVGVYYWAKGSDYIKYAEQMIEKNIRVNNEFYVCPVINEAISDNKKIKVSYVQEMWGIGTPEDLNTFLKLKKVN
jgi:HAD superfamily hydrolase (TIGR01509 family)